MEEGISHQVECMQGGRDRRRAGKCRSAWVSRVGIAPPAPLRGSYRYCKASVSTCSEMRRSQTSYGTEPLRKLAIMLRDKTGEVLAGSVWLEAKFDTGNTLQAGDT